MKHSPKLLTVNSIIKLETILHNKEPMKISVKTESSGKDSINHAAMVTREGLK